MSDISQEMLFLASKLQFLRDKKENIEADLKRCNAELTTVDEELSQMMINEEIQNFHDGNSTFYLTTRSFISVPVGKRADAVSWCRMNHNDLICVAVKEKEFVAYCKELLKDSDELPAGLKEVVSIFEKPSVGIRKQKNGGEENGKE